MAQQVEHVLGKDEVTGSNPVISSKKKDNPCGLFFFGAGRSQLRCSATSPSRWAFANLFARLRRHKKSKGLIQSCHTFFLYIKGLFSYL